MQDPKSTTKLKVIVVDRNQIAPLNTASANTSPMKNYRTCEKSFKERDNKEKNTEFSIYI